MAKYKSVLASLGILVAGTVSIDAHAGSITSTVREIMVTNGGTVFVQFATNLNSSAGCSSVDNEIAFDGTTDGGKALLSIFQSALLSGKRVQVVGSDNCNVNAQREGISRARLLAQ